MKASEIFEPGVNVEDMSSGFCFECGISANVLTCLKKYGQRPHMLKSSTSTYHQGICGSCGEEKAVTEQRDFFYPDFSLLKRKIIYIKQGNK